MEEVAGDGFEHGAAATEGAQLGAGVFNELSSEAPGFLQAVERRISCLVAGGILAGGFTQFRTRSEERRVGKECRL